MKFSEKEQVSDLIYDVIHNLRKRDEKIDDLTEEQAYELIEQYSGYSRVLLTFPQNLLSNKNFILNCEKNYNIDATLYADESLLTDVEYVLYKIGKDKLIHDKLIKNYEILPKEEKYFIPIVKKLIEYRYYKEAGDLISKVLQGKDLKNCNNALYEINKNLKKISNKPDSLVFEILERGNLKAIKKQFKKLENEINNENKNLQV